MDDAHLVSDNSMNSDECGVADHDSSDYMPSDNPNIDGVSCFCHLWFHSALPFFGNYRI